MRNVNLISGKMSSRLEIFGFLKNRPSLLTGPALIAPDNKGNEYEENWGGVRNGNARTIPGMELKKIRDQHEDRS